jgi:hypothetical protein
MVGIFDRPQAVIAGWSRRRRWILAVCLMAGFLLCGLAAVPVVAYLDYTQRQGDAYGTPVEAADAYLVNLNLGPGGRRRACGGAVRRAKRAAETRGRSSRGTRTAAGG